MLPLLLAALLATGAGLALAAAACLITARKKRQSLVPGDSRDADELTTMALTLVTASFVFGVMAVIL